MDEQMYGHVCISKSDDTNDANVCICLALPLLSAFTFSYRVQLRSSVLVLAAQLVPSPLWNPYPAGGDSKELGT